MNCPTHDLLTLTSPQAKLQAALNADEVCESSSPREVTASAGDGDEETGTQDSERKDGARANADGSRHWSERRLSADALSSPVLLSDAQGRDVTSVNDSSVACSEIEGFSPDTVVISAHCHPLHRTSNPYSGVGYICDVCSKRGMGWAYHCAICNFDSHMLCAGVDNLEATGVPPRDSPPVLPEATEDAAASSGTVEELRVNFEETLRLLSPSRAVPPSCDCTYSPCSHSADTDLRVPIRRARPAPPPRPPRARQPPDAAGTTTPPFDSVDVLTDSVLSHPNSDEPNVGASDGGASESDVVPTTRDSTATERHGDEVLSSLLLSEQAEASDSTCAATGASTPDSSVADIPSTGNSVESQAEELTRLLTAYHNIRRSAERHGGTDASVSDNACTAASRLERGARFDGMLDGCTMKSAFWGQVENDPMQDVGFPGMLDGQTMASRSDATGTLVLQHDGSSSEERSRRSRRVTIRLRNAGADDAPHCFPLRTALRNSHSVPNESSEDPLGPTFQRHLAQSAAHPHPM